MLPWLQKKLTRKQQLIVRVVLLVLIIHILVITGIFFVRPGEQFQKKINVRGIHNQGMKVVYLPLYKSIKNAKQASVNSSISVETNAKKAPEAQLINGTKKTIAKKNGENKKKNGSSQELVKGTSAKKNMEQKQSKKTITSSIKNEPKKQDVTEKKANKSQAKKKSEKQKVGAEKMKAEKPQPVPKPTKNEKKNSVNSKSKVEDVIKRENQTSPSHCLDTSVALALNVSGQDADVLYVGRDEYALIKVQQHLQEELSRVWKAPKIMENTEGCDVFVTIDQKGRAKKVKITKSSGSKLYDILAQDAFRKISYAPPLWGKEADIHFEGQ